MNPRDLDQSILHMLAAMQGPSLTSDELEKTLVALGMMDMHRVFHALGRILTTNDSQAMQLYAAYFMLHIASEHEAGEAPRAVAHFSKVFESGDVDAQAQALCLLNQLKQMPDTLYPLIEAKLDHADEMIRIGAAALLLGYAEELNIKVLYLLGQGLRSDNASVRQLALMGLARFRSDKTIFMAKLYEWLESKNEDHQHVACSICLQIDTKAEAITLSLLRLVTHQDTSPSLRLVATQALVSQQTNSPDHFQTAFLAAIRNQDWPVTVLLLEQLGKQLSVSHEVIFHVEKLLDHQDATVRSLTVLPLGKWQRLAEPLMPKFIQMMQTETDKQVVRSLVLTLAGLGQVALPCLLPLLEQDDIRLTPLVVSILARMSWEDVDRICESLLTHQDSHLQEMAASIAMLMGPRARPLVSRLRQLLNDETYSGKIACLMTLHAMDHEAEPAIPELLRFATQSEDEEARVWAVQTLVKTGAAGLQALHLASRKVSQDIRQQLQDILKRHGQRLTVSMEEQLPDEESLIIFILYAEMFLEKGRASTRSLSKQLNEAQSKGLYPELNGTSPNFVDQKLDALQEHLSKVEGKKVKLLEGKEKQSKKLTRQGKRLLPEAKQWLEQIRQQRRTPRSNTT